MNRILVATDGSEGADRAVDYAAHYASRDGAELVIVNIVGGYGLPGSVFRSVTPGQHARLEQQLATISANTLTEARDRATASVSRRSCSNHVAAKSRTRSSRLPRTWAPR